MTSAPKGAQKRNTASEHPKAHAGQRARQPTAPTNCLQVKRKRERDLAAASVPDCSLLLPMPLLPPPCKSHVFSATADCIVMPKNTRRLVFELALEARRELTRKGQLQLLLPIDLPPVIGALLPTPLCRNRRQHGQHTLDLAHNILVRPCETAEFSQASACWQKS